MNATDSSAPPAEDRVDFPDAWREHTLDWRARGNARPVEVDPAAADRLEARFRSERARFEPPLRALETSAYETPIREGIAGKADPLAAGLALALLIRLCHEERHQLERLGVEAWITAHGIAFAAAAVMEHLGHSLYWHEGWSRRAPSARVSDLSLHNMLYRNEPSVAVTLLRSLLAALPESEYAEVREAIAARRTTDAKRFLSAMLMPEQEAWTVEACDFHSATSYSEDGDVIWSVASSAEHRDRSGAQRLRAERCGPPWVARLLDALGVDALPILVNSLEREGRMNADFRRTLFDALCRLPSDAAMAYLLERLTDPPAYAAARGAAKRFPHRVLRAVAAIAPAVTEKARLAGFVRSNGLVERVAALSEADRERVEALLAATGPRPEADEVPPVFATPPWAPFAKAAKSKPVEGLEPPAVDELRWAPGERERWDVPSIESSFYLSVPDVWDRHMPNGTDPNHYLFPEFLIRSEEVETPAVFALWNGTIPSSSIGTARTLLSRHERDAAPKILELVKKKRSFRPLLMPFVNLEAARMAADWASRSRTDRALGEAWLDRHAADAAALLIPDAVGKEPKRRQAAADALRRLAASQRSLVDEQALSYGAEAAAAVAALLDADPLDPQVARLSRPGAWADPAMLPQVLLKGGDAALPESAVRTLLTALALDDPLRPYAGVDLLAAECDPASLTAFSWSLFELWLTAGAPSKDAWAMDQLRRFADDDTVRRLSGLVHEWPGQSQSRKAVRGLEVLGWIGSEAALRAVHEISQKAKFKALKKTATEQIEVIAEGLGLNLDQLADRLVPSFGLNADGPLVLDYGSRRFQIRFDEHLKPYLVDGDGKRRASAPKPGAKDELEIAQPAYERFTRFCKELKTTSAEQVKRLEAAMVAGRTWGAAEFRTYLVEHPLMRHLSGRLVWRAETAAGPRSFRIAEDRTFADAEDEPFDLPGDAAVRLAHPLLLGSEVEAWSTVLADYEILQPFDQLARPVFTLSEEERATGRLARFEGGTVGAGPIVGLLKRGWKYGNPPGGRAYGDVFLEFPEGGHLALHPSPGVYPGYDPGGDQTLEIAIALPENGIDPVALSEALYVVARLTRTA